MRWLAVALVLAGTFICPVISTFLEQHDVDWRTGLPYGWAPLARPSFQVIWANLTEDRGDGIVICEHKDFIQCTILTHPSSVCHSITDEWLPTFRSIDTGAWYCYAYKDHDCDRKHKEPTGLLPRYSSDLRESDDHLFTTIRCYRSEQSHIDNRHRSLEPSRLDNFAPIDSDTQEKLVKRSGSEGGGGDSSSSTSGGDNPPTKHTFLETISKRGFFGRSGGGKIGGGRASTSSSMSSTPNSGTSVSSTSGSGGWFSRLGSGRGGSSGTSTPGSHPLGKSAKAVQAQWMANANNVEVAGLLLCESSKKKECLEIKQPSQKCRSLPERYLLSKWRTAFTQNLVCTTFADTNCQKPIKGLSLPHESNRYLRRTFSFGSLHCRPSTATQAKDGSSTQQNVTSLPGPSAVNPALAIGQQGQASGTGQNEYQNGLNEPGSNNGMMSSSYNRGTPGSDDQGFVSNPYAAPGSDDQPGYGGTGQSNVFGGQSQQQGAYPATDDHAGGPGNSGTGGDDQTPYSKDEYDQRTGGEEQSDNGDDPGYQGSNPGSKKGSSGTNEYDKYGEDGTPQHTGSDPGHDNADNGYGDGTASQHSGQEEGSGRNSYGSDSQLDDQKDEDQDGVRGGRSSDNHQKSSYDEDEGYGSGDDQAAQGANYGQGGNQGHRSSSENQYKRAADEPSRPRDLYGVTSGNDKPLKRASYHAPIGAATTLVTRVKRVLPTTIVADDTLSAKVSTENIALPSHSIAPAEALARDVKIGADDGHSYVGTDNMPALFRRRGSSTDDGQSDMSSSAPGSDPNGDRSSQGSAGGGQGSSPNHNGKAQYGSPGGNMNDGPGGSSYNQPGYDQAPARNSDSRSGYNNGAYQAGSNQGTGYNNGGGANYGAGGIGVPPSGGVTGYGGASIGPAGHGDSRVGAGGNVNPGMNHGRPSPHDNEDDQDSDEDTGTAEGDNDSDYDADDEKNGSSSRHGNIDQSDHLPAYDGERPGQSVPNNGGDARYGTGNSACDENRDPSTCNPIGAAHHVDSLYGIHPSLNPPDHLAGNIPIMSNPFSKPGDETTEPETSDPGGNSGTNTTSTDGAGSTAPISTAHAVSTPAAAPSPTNPPPSSPAASTPTPTLVDTSAADPKSGSCKRSPRGKGGHHSGSGTSKTEGDSAASGGKGDKCT